MSRFALRSAGFLFGLAVVVGAAAPWGLGQNKVDPKKVDPKDAKKADPKKVDPKKVDPKQPAPKPPAPKKVEARPPAAKQPDPKKTDPNSEPAPEPPPPIPDGPPNPLDLVRGLRAQGMSDLALEYLQELEKKPGVAAGVKAEVPLERAKCQLEAADDEPDEGTRLSMIGEAKEGFGTFLKNFPTHPRAAEAYLALARLTSMDAKAQLSRARRIDVPEEGDPAREQAVQQQKAEAVKARQIFEAANNQLKAAVKLIDAQLAKTTDPADRRALNQVIYDAEIARGTNQFDLAGTYLHPNNADIKAKDEKIEEARSIFFGLTERAGVPARVTGLARAWMAECLFEQKQLIEAEAEVKRIEASAGPNSEDAKRMVRFFTVRRKVFEALGQISTQSMQAAEAACREWLRQYGTVRRAQTEAIAVRWYLANALQIHGDLNMPKTPATPPKTPTPVTVPLAARTRYAEAEKMYRVIAQSDNEYTARATRKRMYVVRRLLGEADQPPAAYKTFEDCQMASLIHMARLMDLEKDPGKADEVKDRRLKVVALLERARQLATPQDNPGDVTDVLLRLIYFYQVTDQPQLAAILAEHVARTVKAAGGKAADAGTRGIYAYVGASGQIRTTDAESRAAALKTDRDRAIRLARFLDEKYPNDAATDRARFALGRLLYEDGKPVEAYDTVLKVRAGFDQVAAARLFQGAVASQLLSAKDSPLAPERRRDVFRRTTSDLDKLVKPLPAASDDDARAYLSARCRLALLYLLQPRVDPEGEKLDPGYAKARKVAEDALGLVPTFAALAGDAASKAPNLDGWELRLLAEDARTRAVYLQGQALFLKGKYDEAYKSIGDVLADMNRAGPYSEQVKAALAAKPKPMAPAPTPEPKKEPAKKEPGKKAPEPKADTAPKKGPEPKKEPEKKAPEPKAEEDDETPAEEGDAGLKARLAKDADGVDRLRRELVVLALKIRVKQGQAEKGVEQLDLLKKYGGSIEANVGTLEQVTAEMAAQILSLRREGKPDEAKAVSDGFAKLLDKVSAEPNLPASVQRFLGQSLILVGQYDKAIAALQKVPVPADKAALAAPNDIKDNPDKKKQVLEYRRAALELTRAYRLGGKFAEADALLADVMGTQEKQGWGFSSVDFRKEVALLHEAKGTAEPDVKKANAEWSKALREWSTIFNIYRTVLAKGPPMGPTGMPNNQAFLATKNAYFEAFFNVQRCLVKANKQLLAAPQFAAKLQKTYEDVGKRFADLEKASGDDINQEVREMYHDLLVEMPELRKGYEAAGGKIFLDRPTAPGVGGM